MSNHITQERHDCKVVLNKSKLNIEADIFVDMPCCIVWFCTEDWTHLEDTLKDSHHNLLIELGTLRQVCISVKSRLVKIERKADIAPAESRKIARLSRCRFVIAALSSSVLIFAVILRLFNETGGTSVTGVITSM